MENLNKWRLILILEKGIIHSPNKYYKKYLELKRYIFYRLVR